MMSPFRLGLRSAEARSTPRAEPPRIVSIDELVAAGADDASARPERVGYFTPFARDDLWVQLLRAAPESLVVPLTVVPPRPHGWAAYFEAAGRIETFEERVAALVTTGRASEPLADLWRRVTRARESAEIAEDVWTPELLAELMAANRDPRSPYRGSGGAAKFLRARGVAGAEQAESDF